MQWYMLQTANGFEGAVERTIMMAVQAQRLHDKIEQASRHAVALVDVCDTAGVLAFEESDLLGNDSDMFFWVVGACTWR